MVKESNVSFGTRSIASLKLPGKAFLFLCPLGLPASYFFMPEILFPLLCLFISCRFEYLGIDCCHLAPPTMTSLGFTKQGKDISLCFFLKTANLNLSENLVYLTNVTILKHLFTADNDYTFHVYHHVLNVC